jgi:hypothetical protein
MPTDPLNFEEHRDLGQELQNTRQRIARLSSMALEVYGPNNRCAFAFEKLNQALQHLIDELARQAVADCPGTSAEDLYRK